MDCHKNLRDFIGPDLQIPIPGSKVIETKADKDGKTNDADKEGNKDGKSSKATLTKKGKQKKMTEMTLLIHHGFIVSKNDLLKSFKFGHSICA